MKVADFDYELPPELIAQEPAERRDGARMMVLDRSTRTIAHRRFTDLPEFLRPPDLLVVNDTRVIPARLFGRKAKEGTGGKVEFLLLEETSPGQWDALMRCRRRPKPGDQVLLDEDLAVVTVLEDGELGRVKIRVESALPWLEVLDRIGQTPLPPYIQRKNVSEERAAADKVRYQTVFAREPGAVAAPTAGLHLTPEVFAALDAKGVRRAHLTLHVGYGTFKPITAERLEDHRVDAEDFEFPEDTAGLLNATRAAGGRVMAVGTTVTRVLETQWHDGRFHAGAGQTTTYIHPPHTFRGVDILQTNFHLPKSSLLALVCAFAGRELTMEAYAHAVRNRFRFYSYGDVMLIL